MLPTVSILLALLIKKGIVITWCTECHCVAIRKTTKVFTKWHDAGYFVGQPGDYLVLKESDPSDVYLVRSDIFNQLYEAC